MPLVRNVTPVTDADGPSPVTAFKPVAAASPTVARPNADDRAMSCPPKSTVSAYTPGYTTIVSPFPAWATAAAIVATAPGKYVETTTSKPAVTSSQGSTPPAPMSAGPPRGSLRPAGPASVSALLPSRERSSFAEIPSAENATKPGSTARLFQVPPSAVRRPPTSPS